jgi:hypothetical protein
VFLKQNGKPLAVNRNGMWLMAFGGCTEKKEKPVDYFLRRETTSFEAAPL